MGQNKGSGIRQKPKVKQGITLLHITHFRYCKMSSFSYTLPDFTETTGWRGALPETVRQQEDKAESVNQHIS